MTDSGYYSVECVKCDESRSGDQFESIREFAVKHREHTGHGVRWVTTNIDPELSKKLDLEHRVKCSECQDRWNFEHESDAEDFFEDHAEVTDHSADEVEHIQEQIEIDRPEDLVHLIERVNRRTDGGPGVPRKIVITAAKHRGGTRSQVKRWIEGLKQEGELYEPSHPYLQAL